MSWRLGIDVACRADHWASLADERGEFAWSEARFTATVVDLAALWAKVPAGEAVTVVPTTQSADLRADFSKHAKIDRLDSRVLARLPLLHPEGLLAVSGAGPPATPAPSAPYATTSR